VGFSECFFYLAYFITALGERSMSFHLTTGSVAAKAHSGDRGLKEYPPAELGASLKHLLQFLPRRVLYFCISN